MGWYAINLSAKCDIVALDKGTHVANVIYIEDEQEWPKYWHLWDSRCYRKSTGRWAIYWIPLHHILRWIAHYLSSRSQYVCVNIDLRWLILRRSLKSLKKCASRRSNDVWVSSQITSWNAQLIIRASLAKCLCQPPLVGPEPEAVRVHAWVADRH